MWRDALRFGNYPLYVGTVSKDVFLPVCEHPDFALGGLMDDGQVHSEAAEPLLITTLPGMKVFQRDPRAPLSGCQAIEITDPKELGFPLSLTLGGGKGRSLGPARWGNWSLGKRFHIVLNTCQRTLQDRLEPRQWLVGQWRRLTTP